MTWVSLGSAVRRALEQSDLVSQDNFDFFGFAPEGQDLDRPCPF